MENFFFKFVQPSYLNNVVRRSSKFLFLSRTVLAISLTCTIDRAPMIRKIFVYWQKLDGAEEVCACRSKRGWDGRRLALRTVTNGSAGPSSPRTTVKYISWAGGVTIEWMSARYRARPISNSSAGFFILPGLVSRRSSEPITRVIYYRLSYENNILLTNINYYVLVCLRVYLCIRHRTIIRKKGNAHLSGFENTLTLRNDRTIPHKHHDLSLKIYERLCKEWFCKCNYIYARKIICALRQK